MSQSDDLGKELLTVEENTLEEGRVQGRIEEVESNEGSIDVTIKALTTRENFTVEFEKPTSWSRSYQFVRLVQWIGYNSASAAQIEGDYVPITEEDGVWEIDTERFPGDNLIEREDYYWGAFKGVVSMGILCSVLYFVLVEAQHPTFLSEFLGFGAILIVAATMAKWIHVSVDDDKETISFAEMGRSDVNMSERSKPK